MAASASMVIVVMGVCGVGKTTVGQALAEKLSCPFEDADSHHSSSNVEKMSQGIPLTDQDRLPWLISLHEKLYAWLKEEEDNQDMSDSASDKDTIRTREGATGRVRVGGVLACSALKRSYRDVLNGHKIESERQIEEKVQPLIDVRTKVLFVHLDGPPKLIKERMESRRGHYMPPSLLDTQLATLELPTHPNEFCIRCDIEENVTIIVDLIINKIQETTITLNIC
ncbi:PREDICTED: probable gluconokinase [Amphimedon queenslandica]|uniref:gluconokinase n=1 Tax=Amphimedon queenslandica TaxID=400682 RepID=A0A1X7U2B7_AMPQE|nr:PREDICTED: probable gluconokinase [Amphimedon queenslandica]|eukprot:XP_003389204.1 PREDICTED: probable gluconokinase [Amphimedon queenslandica]